MEHIFQYLNAADIDAIGTYIRAFAPVHDPDDTMSRFNIGQPTSRLATLRGSESIRSDSGNPSGAELFQPNCASYHSANAQGSTGTYYPSLFHNSTVGASNPNNLIATILNGVNRPVGGRQAFMPGFGGHTDAINQLSDHAIVLLTDYVRQQYDKGGPPDSADKVAEVRLGWPSSSLVTLVRIGAAIVDSSGNPDSVNRSGSRENASQQLPFPCGRAVGAVLRPVSRGQS
jgi:mono/diheme cytochrome c family protein